MNTVILTVRVFVYCAATIPVLSMLASCGGREQVAGIDGSGIGSFAEGPIEAFGSIFVNGVRYDIDSAEIRVNGNFSTEADLAIGQVVTVQASVDPLGNAVADSVQFEAALRGAVQSIDLANDAFVVLEQEVQVGPDSTIDLSSGADLGALSVDDFVEVSGFTGAGGVVEATRVASAEVSDGSRIIGRAAGLNEGTFQFFIGSLLIDYSGAGLIEGFPDGGPENGDEVLAVGDALDASGNLLVTRLAYIDDSASSNEGQEAEVEGLITRFVSPTDFDVSGRRSTTNAQTDYEGGSESDLQLNVKIQIEGRFDSEGTIVATKIEVKDGGAVQH
jgi:hypothetical protein